MAGGIARGGLRERRYLRMGLLAAALSAVMVLGFFGELAVADFLYDTNPHASLGHRVAVVWRSGDHLHYAVHLAAGRLLDLCPCTAHAAATQYWRASFHARSVSQLDLVTDQVPSTPAARAADTLNLAVHGVGWSVGELGRLSGPLLIK